MPTHERDALLEFNEVEHKYKIQDATSGTWKECDKSVTGFLASFFEEFDTDGAIENNYDNWQKRKDPRYYGMTKEEIKDKWKTDGEDAANLGTKLHKAIEDFYNEDPSDASDVETEFGFFEKFNAKLNKEKPGISCHKNEWRVCTNHDLLLAGTMDMVYEHDGKYYIYDWKRSKKISKEGFWGKTGLNPINTIPDSSFHKYSLQLNCYKYILENYYDMHIEGMCFVVFHPDNTEYVEYHVDDLQDEIKKMMTKRKDELAP